MAKRLQFSRWRRLPGVSRVGERKLAGPGEEEQRLTLYLPGKVIDRAEALAAKAGAESVRQYCERLLMRALDDEHAREQVEEVEAKRGPLEGLDAIANDPEYLAEWKAMAPVAPAGRPPKMLAAPREITFMDSGPTAGPPIPAGELSAEQVVLKHALLLGDDPSAFLATLRRGEPVGPDSAHELLQALVDLEAKLGGSGQIDRRLAYALHRLAFEGQVLLTDAWPGASVDATTVDVLRMVQEGVDRVLSGEDIRYFPREDT
jgi:hypothetical protein